MNWLKLKESWLELLLPIYEQQEANNILLIIAEELLPHFNKLAFRDASFELEKDDVEILVAAYTRLLHFEPMQYILEKAWFYDLELKVNKYVLIPRPETEELVTWILESMPPIGSRILDIGTGSGCIPLTLAKHLPAMQIAAVDIDPNALELAKENAHNLNLQVDFSLLDILDEQQWAQLGVFDIIVSNPPYIPHKEKLKMRENVLAFEPYLALFVEYEDALLFYKKIADFAKQHLSEGGQLYFECNEFNAMQCKAMLLEKGFLEVEIKQDLQGKDRMISCNV